MISSKGSIPRHFLPNMVYWNGSMFKKGCQIGFFLMVVLKAGATPSTDFLAEGEKLLLQNKPQEALTFFEASLGQGQASQKLFLNLGTAYYALGQLERAKTMFDRGLQLPGELTQTLLFNLGNVMMAQRKYKEAEENFTKALTLDAQDGDVYLNRANTRLIQQNYQGALDDYLQVLALQPQNPQRPQIMRLTDLLQAHLASIREAERLAEAQRLAQIAREEEARREAQRIAAIQEEERKRAEELARLEAERRQQEEAQRLAEENRRREELLARIRESLARAAEETKNLSASEGQIKKPHEELDLAE